MELKVVDLTSEHLEKIRGGVSSELEKESEKSYFSEGSAAYCVLADGVPVIAGGIVSLQWKRGEAWLQATPFFRAHLKTCVRAIRNVLPMMAVDHGFRRVQATCVSGVSVSLIRHLGFSYEGTMQEFGPQGETCQMWARVFPLVFRGQA